MDQTSYAFARDFMRAVLQLPGLEAEFHRRVHMSGRSEHSVMEVAGPILYRSILSDRLNRSLNEHVTDRKIVISASIGEGGVTVPVVTIEFNRDFGVIRPHLTLDEVREQRVMDIDRFPETNLHGPSTSELIYAVGKKAEPSENGLRHIPFSLLVPETR